jgi:hypothetical protein
MFQIFLEKAERRTQIFYDDYDQSILDLRLQIVD